MDYLYLFAQSNLLEMPVYFLFLKSFQNKLRFIDKIIFVTGLNAITHPIVFFIIMNLKFTYLQNIIMAEVFAVITEGIILKISIDQGFLPCFLASFFANLVSWQISPMLTYAFY